MSDNFDYEKMDNTDYTVPSMYGKWVREEYNKQPDYCSPGEVGGGMKGDKSNKQDGP